MILSHKIALDPTTDQLQALAQGVGTARFTWNWALAKWNELYAKGEKPTGNSLKKQWNQIKREQFPWAYESPKDANQQPFSNLQKAFGRFFRGDARRPRFKRRGRHDSFYLSNTVVRLEGKRIRLPKIGWIRLRERLRFAGKIMSVTVSRTASRWFASIAVELGDDYSRTRTGDGVVGVDLGLRHAAVLSDGQAFDAPKPLKRMRRAARVLSRRQKGSRRRERARRCLARMHAKIANVRSDFMHKLTTRLCRENQAVAIENLDVQGMLRSGGRGLSRAIADVGFYEFRRQLTYKAELHGTELVVADRWFPSSKTCSGCGVKKSSLSLSEREFACEGCGLIMDRDLNAAMNLKQLAAGHAVTARGGDARPGFGPAAPVKREPEGARCVIAQ